MGMGPLIFIHLFQTLWMNPLRCTVCATFTATIRKVVLSHERAQLERAQAEHIKNVRQFRQIQTRLNSLSEASTSTQGDGSQCSGILKIDCDGLDQAKTRYPRNLASAKSLSNLWRPQIHLVSCIVWGETQLFIQQSIILLGGVCGTKLG